MQSFRPAPKLTAGGRADGEAAPDLTAINARRVEDQLAAGYLERLGQRVGAWRRLYDNPDFDPGLQPHGVPAFLDRVRHTVSALQLRQRLYRQRVLGSPLTIDPTDSGFPTFAEIMMVSDDRAEAEQRLAELPPRSNIISAARREVFAGRHPSQQQTQWLLHGYFTALRDQPVLSHLDIPPPVSCGEQDGRRAYLIEWCGIDAGANLPVHYLMLFDQDPRARPLERDAGELNESIEAAFQRYLSPNGVAACVDELETIHPKVVRKFTVGPYYDRHTANPPEVSALLSADRDAFLLCTSTEVSGSMGAIIQRRWWDRLSRRRRQRERFGPELVDRRVLTSEDRADMVRGAGPPWSECIVYAMTPEGQVLA